MSSKSKKRKWSEALLYDPDVETSTPKLIKPPCHHLPCGHKTGTLPIHVHFDHKAHHLEGEFGPLDWGSIQKYERRSAHPTLIHTLEIMDDISYRRVMIGWLFELAHDYGFATRTLCLAVELLDRYLKAEDEMPVDRTTLQLMGVAALWIATKYEEIYPLTLEKAALATDGAYNKDQLKFAELRILSRVNWTIESFTIWDVLWLEFGILVKGTSTSPEIQEILRMFMQKFGYRMTLLVKYMLCLPAFLKYSNAVKATALVYANFDVFVLEQGIQKAAADMAAPYMMTSIGKFLQQLWGEETKTQFEAVVHCQAQLDVYVRAIVHKPFATAAKHGCLQYESGCKTLYPFLEMELQNEPVDWKHLSNSGYVTWKREEALQVLKQQISV